MSSTPRSLSPLLHPQQPTGKQGAGGLWRGWGQGCPSPARPRGPASLCHPSQDHSWNQEGGAPTHPLGGRERGQGPDSLRARRL